MYGAQEVYASADRHAQHKFIEQANGQLLRQSVNCSKQTQPCLKHMRAAKRCPDSIMHQAQDGKQSTPHYARDGTVQATSCACYAVFAPSTHVLRSALAIPLHKLMTFISQRRQRQ